MKALTFGLFLLLSLFVVTVPTIFADEDEDEWDDDDRSEYEQRGSSEIEREQEREREREHEDDDDDEEGLAFGGGMPDTILYGTIVVIIGSVAYTGYKIYKTKRPKLSA